MMRLTGFRTDFITVGHVPNMTLGHDSLIVAPSVPIRHSEPSLVFAVVVEISHINKKMTLFK